MEIAGAKTIPAIFFYMIYKGKINFTYIYSGKFRDSPKISNLSPSCIRIYKFVFFTFFKHFLIRTVFML